MNETDAGPAPSRSLRLRFAEWKDLLRRTLKEFMKDDCMGLSQEVAYSALLAFFPTVAFILGFLGMVHLYGQVESFAATIAPQGVISFIRGLQKDSHGSASVARVRDRARPRDLGGERRDGLGDQGGEPRDRPRRDAAVLEGAPRLDPARAVDGRDARRAAGADRLRRPARPGDRREGRPRHRVGRALGPAALADRVRGRARLLRARLLPRSERRAAQLAMDHARDAARRGDVARPLGRCSRST